MSDKSGKTGLILGSSWSLFAENTAFEESDVVGERQGNLAEATRLHSEDIVKFGSCPSQESLKLTVCKECNKLLIVSAIQRHYEYKHAKLLAMIKPAPPKRCIPATHHPPTNKRTHSSSLSSSFSHSKIMKTGNNEKNFIRIEEVDPNDASVKIEEVPLTIPQFETSATKNNKMKVGKLNIKKLGTEKYGGGLSSPTFSSSQVSIQVKGITKKIPLMKDKEFEPDKHCGVWIPEMSKNCTRSLTCKTHPLSMRREVPGRSKEFDALLAEHRARVALKSQDSNNTTTSNTASSSPQSRGTPAHSPYGFEKIVFPTVIGPSNKDILPSPKSACPKYDEVDYVDYIPDETFTSSNLSYKQYHPRPIKVNNFGSRQTECHCRLYSRQMDHFRNALGSMLNTFNNNTSSKHATKNTKEAKSHAGMKSALQDPLQNGILHKQKGEGVGGSSGSGGRNISKLSLKRHLPLSEVDGFVVDNNSNRRHSSDINIVDPFSMNTNNPQQQQTLLKPFVGKTLTTSSNTTLNLTNDSNSSSNTTHIDISAIDDFLSANLANSPSPSNRELSNQNTNTLSLSSSANALNGRTNNFQITPNDNSNTQNHHRRAMNAMTNMSATPVVTVNALNTENLIAVNNNNSNSNNTSLLTTGHTPSSSTSSSAKMITPAPNITITQGMIVSLPNASGLRSSLQNTFTVTPQTLGKQLRVHEQSSSTSNLTLKQVLSRDKNLRLSIPNGSNLASSMTVCQDTNASSSPFAIDSLDSQLPAPNITVTASTLSLSGVLQGQSVPSSAANKTTFKRINSINSNTNHCDPTTRILQQLLIQQQQQQQQQQQAALQRDSQVSVTGDHNFTSSVQQLSTPTNIGASNLSLQRTQALQQQQLQQQQQQQQLSGAQFITMQHAAGGFPQQILPKLPVASQNISATFTGGGSGSGQQFSSANVQNGLQFIAQATNTSTLQKHSSSTLS